MRYTQGEDYEDKHFVDSRTELALWNALFDPNLECATSNLASIRIHSTVCPIYLFGKNIHREVTMENVFFEGEVRIFCIPKIEDDDIPRINFRNCYIFHLELIRIGELDSMQFAMFINCRIGNTVVDDNIPLDILEQLFSNCTDTSGNRLKLR